ncbi:MAG: ADP-ribosylglycohydrolase family protein, partial [Anaerolineae bacterium]|nr:ADP-ribosylglycohydrolase family protein [Anaerolineae bacterium]
DWKDYTVTATLEAHFCQSFGLAMHVQGLNRYYALLLKRPGKAILIKSLDTPTRLAEIDFNWHFDQRYTFTLFHRDGLLYGLIDGKKLFAVREQDVLLNSGAVGVVVEEGRVLIRSVEVGR